MGTPPLIVESTEEYTTCCSQTGADVGRGEKSKLEACESGLMEIKGVFPIVATPFDESGEVDLGSLRTELSTLIAGGCHGLILFGVAGEFYKLSDAEQKRMIEVATDEVSEQQTPLIVSITDQSPDVAIEKAQFAEDSGVDGLMALPPSMLGPSPSDQFEHLKSLGESVDIPIIVQYAPETAGSPIDMSVFAELTTELDNIHHFKIESSPPGKDITRLIEMTNEDANILVGNAGKQMIEALDRGATGVIPGASMHEIYLDIYEKYHNGNRTEAISIFDELLPFLNLSHQSPMMLVHYEKRILKERGVISSARCRSPRYTPDKYYDQLFKEHYDKLKDYLTY